MAEDNKTYVRGRARSVALISTCQPHLSTCLALSDDDCCGPFRPRGHGRVHGFAQLRCPHSPFPRGNASSDVLLARACMPAVPACSAAWLSRALWLRVPHRTTLTLLATAVASSGPTVRGSSCSGTPVSWATRFVPSRLTLSVFSACRPNHAAHDASDRRLSRPAPCEQSLPPFPPVCCLPVVCRTTLLTTRACWCCSLSADRFDHVPCCAQPGHR